MRRAILGLALLALLVLAPSASAWTWPLHGDVLRPVLARPRSVCGRAAPRRRRRWRCGRARSRAGRRDGLVRGRRARLRPNGHDPARRLRRLADAPRRDHGGEGRRRLGGRPVGLAGASRRTPNGPRRTSISASASRRRPTGTSTRRRSCPRASCAPPPPQSPCLVPDRAPGTGSGSGRDAARATPLVAAAARVDAGAGTRRAVLAVGPGTRSRARPWLPGPWHGSAATAAATRAATTGAPPPPAGRASREHGGRRLRLRRRDAAEPQSVHHELDCRDAARSRRGGRRAAGPAGPSPPRRRPGGARRGCDHSHEARTVAPRGSRSGAGAATGSRERKCVGGPCALPRDVLERHSDAVGHGACGRRFGGARPCRAVDGRVERRGAGDAGRRPSPHRPAGLPPRESGAAGRIAVAPRRLRRPPRRGRRRCGVAAGAPP